MIRFAAASTALAVAILSAGAASASEYRIPIGDLDLATPQGDAAFDRRIQGFAHGACVSGSSLDQAHCRREFRADVLNALPAQRREDYARARVERMVVRAPVTLN